MAFQGFNHQSGPAFPRNSHGFSGNFSQSPNSSNPLKRQIAPQQQSQRLSAHTNLVFDNEIFKAPEREMSSTLLPESTSSAGKHNSPFNAAQGISHVSPYDGQRDAETDFPVNRANLPVTKRLRSPPLQSSNDDSLRSPSLSVDNPGRLRSRTNLFSDNVNYEISKRTRSPSSAFGNYLSDKDFNHRREEAQGSALSPSRWGNWPNSDSASNLQAHQSSPPSAPHVDIPDSGSRFLTQSAKFNVPKRMRSPPLPSPTEVSLLNSHLTRSEAEREIEAKAKRLARFNVELSQPIEDLNKKKDLRSTQNQLAVEKQMKYPRAPPGETGESLNGNFLGDVGGLEPSTVVVGLCQDMCPESERAERERKGDLDKYERLDGDRNQTAKYLAVKKYNRTAEREADLIRPMPVLQNTIGYLLGLLNQPYDSEFLGIYNFLWDRMRAIRMDLRMQHLFNEDAITMLEQMIRFHIIAMHELCEFTKGEGFMEGFDAHLNIEQMNKASVELFQMYDDHRKKGTSVPTEKEFRGYYALLKLDKHPGYKVEPGELSLDLAKMTPEIRGAPDVLFARDVARACRTGNFIAFFRLARKASYLQACLMHAHFAKLRTQALASLHSGLQNNQGIPVPQVVNWLGMEEEEIESLLEYHGFSIKKFDFSYMVKEGSFLNSDKDYPNTCSKLVHLKKSETIIVDVSSIQITPSLPSKGRKTLKKLDSFDQKPARFIETETLVNVADEEMADFEGVSAPGLDNHLVNATIEVPYSIAQQHETDLPAHMPSEGYFSLGKIGRVAEAFADNNDNNTPMNGFTSNKRLFSSPGKVPQSASQMLSQVESSVSPLVPQSSLQGPLLIKTSGRSSHDMVVMESDFPQKNVIGHVQDMMLVHRKDEEAVSAKLRLILRIWKRRSAKQRELREQHQLAAGAALNLLSLGPPLQQYKEEHVHTCELDIDHVRKERLDRLGKSRARINVAEVVGPILSERNPQAKCLCWKLLICSQPNDTERDGTTNYLARKWLFAKLMATAKVDDDELVLSSPGLSVWKRLILNRVGKPQTCCLSVIREVPLQGIGYVEKDTTFVGASSILFLLADHLPWDLQRVRLLNVLSALPCGSNLPLLVCVSGVLEEGIPDPSVTVANRLGLYNLDKTRISSFTVVFLSGEGPQEHLNVVLTDNCLREGLRWLATQSPLQPVLREVKTRELVMSCLATSLEELVEMEISKVGPNHCISTFNMALDSSAKEIIAAADVNPTGWPCPEIELLQNSTFEQRAVSSFLPRIGWSSAAGIESTVGRIKACKLPPFADDVSWLNQGCDMGQEIRHQKEALEKCLIWYLTDKIMPVEMAEREAVLMLNKGAVLELNGLKYRIVPRWVMIFRRIYNWQLENLIGGEFSSAYILNGQSRPGSEPSQAKATTTPFKFGRMEEFDATRGTSPEYQDGLALSKYVLTKPSLDEMLEVGFKHQPIRGGTAPAPYACQPSPPNALQPSSGQPQGGSESMEITLNNSNVDGDNLRHGLLDESGDIHSSDGNSSVVNKVEEDRFSILLAQCNLLQDRIAKKLAIYF